MSTAQLPRTLPTLDQLLAAALERIQVTRAEIAEARRRRDLVATALTARFPHCRIYVNGSIAHGDALNPLTDVDLGVVIHDPGGTYGPGKRGPSELQEQAAAAIKAELASKYPKLRVELAGRKRSLLIRFGDPVARGQDDFTADVIVAIDNPDAAGLFIPRYTSWDRSDPEKHTKLILSALDDTDVAYARVVRLVKHWNRSLATAPLCSWNIKALALGSITRPVDLLDGLHLWFTDAIADLRIAETEDPAGVAEKPIKLNVPRTKAVTILQEGRDRLDEARSYQDEGYLVLAHESLAKLFNDPEMLPRPDADDVRVQYAAYRRDHAPARPRPVPSIGVRGPAPSAAPRVRSWAP